MQIHKRNVAVVDLRTELIFKAGHRLGELARAEVPNGILIDPDPRRLIKALDSTVEALSTRRPLFEPAFMFQGVIVRVDILAPRGTDEWDLIEVKNSSAVRDYQLRDVAAQAWVLVGAGIKLAKAAIRLPRQVLRPGTRLVKAQGFSDFNVTNDAARLMGELPLVAEAARKIVRGPEPDRQTGVHCTRPFRCEFRQYCSSNRNAT